MIKKNLPLIILFFAAFLTRFLFLNYPSEVVFDEVHFGKFVSAYFTHEYYFDIHPPLGKLMIAGFAEIFKFKPNFNFSRIGESFSDENFLLLRFLPAFFGALFVILIYFFILKIGLSKNAAFFGAFLVLFENALLVQSKFILVDIFLLFFGFLALYFFLSYSQKPQRYFYLVISAVFAALAFSVKWTALSFLAVIILYALFIFLKNRNIKRLFSELAILTIIPFLVYSFIFFIHFNLLYKSGPGAAFMSPNFQNTLLGNVSAQITNGKLPRLNFFQKFIELNAAMYKYNSGITASHPDGSKWYQWPFGQKPIWYWTKNIDNKSANIYFIGNILVWWPIIIIIPFFLFGFLIKKIRKKIPAITFLLIFGYFLNLLPFIFIKRVTFLYHYLPSLIFGIIIFAILLDYLFLKTNFSKNKLKIIYFTYLSGVFLMFILLSPLTYGFLVSPKINQLYSLVIKFFH
jgi:dolichyl-phosphate-mannose-protein mannosyltransferase